MADNVTIRITGDDEALRKQAAGPLQTVIDGLKAGMLTGKKWEGYENAKGGQYNDRNRR